MSALDHKDVLRTAAGATTEKFPRMAYFESPINVATLPEEKCGVLSFMKGLNAGGENAMRHGLTS
jgi:hypothetical protein